MPDLKPKPEDQKPDVKVEVLPPATKPVRPEAIGYTGSYTERATKRKFALKKVETDPKSHKLLTTDHGENGNDERPLYHELDEAEFRNLFDKD